jgi:histidinol dehydrogenase
MAVGRLTVGRLTVEHVARMGGAAGAATHLRSLAPDGASVEASVREIVERVRAHGEQAVLDYTRRFDTDGADPRPLAVPAAELDEAIKLLPLDLVAGLQVAITNVALLAQASVGADETVDLPQGQRIVVREIPVGSAAVYVPGGRAPYASTVVMGVVTARAAGVIDVAVSSPPGPDGQIDPIVLGACRLCGVERVYRMGGAQAIAALAFGTHTVARVDVVVGPGNLYVQEAKRLLSGTVGIDGFAGPSDLLVVLAADASAHELRLAALDMLAQAEHGPGSLVVAVSPAVAVADALQATLESLLAEVAEPGGAALAPGEVAEPGNVAEPGGAALAVVDVDAREAIVLANALAPEHLQLIGDEVEALCSTVRSAGCLFVGAPSATAFGDYVAGSNHVLPTGGSARFSSALSPRHFRRRMPEVRIGSPGAAKLARAGAPIARAEGFEWHARSMEARMEDNI